MQATCKPICRFLKILKIIRWKTFFDFWSICRIQEFFLVAGQLTFELTYSLVSPVEHVQQPLDHGLQFVNAVLEQLTCILCGLFI